MYMYLNVITSFISRMRQDALNIINVPHPPHSLSPGSIQRGGLAAQQRSPRPASPACHEYSSL